MYNTPSKGKKGVESLHISLHRLQAVQQSLNQRRGAVKLELEAVITSTFAQCLSTEGIGFNTHRVGVGISKRQGNTEHRHFEFSLGEDCGKPVLRLQMFTAGPP